MSALWPTFCFQMVEQVRGVFCHRLCELRTQEMVEWMKRQVDLGGRGK